MKKQSELIYGLKPVIELLDGNRSVNRILVDKKVGQDRLKLLAQVAKKNDVPIQFVPKQKLDRICRKNHQGVLAFASPIHYSDLGSLVQSSYESGKDPFFVALDGVTDVRNLGAIARTGYCFGLNGMIIPATGSALVNEDAVKTSAGALENFPVSKVNALEESIAYLKDSGFSVLAITEHADASLYQAKTDGPLVMIMGSEKDGISKKILALCDQKLSIPISGSVGSLNVSVAAGIVMGEIARKKSLDA